MTHSYRGTTALVTGASKGLGRALSLDLARRGARVVLLARSEEDLRALAAQVDEEHGEPRAEVVAADLASPDGVEQVVRELRRRGLRIDLLVNNAGTGSAGPFLDRPLAPQLRSVRVNVDGVLALTHALAADMRARGAGGVITIASGAAFQPMPYVASYGATKAFVLSFTEALAEELRGTGVRIMAAHPGSMATSFFDGTSAEPDPRADAPAEVAAQVLDDFARGRAASYPGRAANRVLTWPARLLTRRATARAAGAVNRRQRLHEVTDLA